MRAGRSAQVDLAAAGAAQLLRQQAQQNYSSYNHGVSLRSPAYPQGAGAPQQAPPRMTAQMNAHHVAAQQAMQLTAQQRMPSGIGGIW